jgi:hypothetical protein
MKMKYLTESDFGNTFAAPMKQVAKDAAPPLDFWSYADAIPKEDFSGHKCQNTVSLAWEDAQRRYQHVLLNTEDKNVFMVLVLDLKADRVLGHHLLDLNEKYGMKAEPNFPAYVANRAAAES